jgi:hypothetical protein
MSKRTIIRPDESLKILGNLEVQGNTTFLVDTETENNANLYVINANADSPISVLRLRSSAGSNVDIINDGTEFVKSNLPWRGSVVVPVGSTLTLDGTLEGNITVSNVAVESADRLTTSRTFSLSGPVTAPGVAFNGTGNVTLETTIAVSPVITLAGPVTGSATLTNLTSATVNTSISNGAVTLGVQTSGNYVEDIQAGNGISKTSGTVGPSQTAILAVGAGDGITVSTTNVSVDSTVARLNDNQTFQGNVSFTGTLTPPAGFISPNSALLEGNNSAYHRTWTNFINVPEVFPPEAHTHSANAITSGQFANSLISSGSVVQHQANLTIQYSQIANVAINGANITSGFVAPARLGSGIADANSFLRGDGAWVVLDTGNLNIDVGNIDAAALTSGIVAPERLATGTASNITFLRGDSQWVELDTGNLDIEVGNIDGSAIQSGTVGDEFLPAIQAGKSFTSTLIVNSANTAPALEATSNSNTSAALAAFRHNIGSGVSIEIDSDGNNLTLTLLDQSGGNTSLVQSNGALRIGSDIIVEPTKVTVGGVVLKTVAGNVSANTSVVAWSEPAPTTQSALLHITAISGTHRQSSEISLLANSGNVAFTEYAVLNIGASLYTVDVGIESSNIELELTNLIGDELTYVINAHLVQE